MTDLPEGFVWRNGRAVTPGYYGEEGTEWPRRRRRHGFCPIVGPHIEHGMWQHGYSGQECGGISGESDG